RCLRALAHHLAELAGQDQVALAREAGRLDEQDVAADRRPGEAGGDAGRAGAHRHLVLEARRPEDRLQRAGIDVDVPGRALGDLPRGMAQRAPDLALEVAHAGLTRVLADDAPQRLVAERRLVGLEAVGSQLATHEVTARDLELLALGVAGQRDDLHAVTERPG